MASQSVQWDVLWEADEAEPPSFDLTRFLDELALELGLGQAECSLVFTNDARIQTLNRDYRNKDRPTDVLSFPQHPHPEWNHLGDVVVNVNRAKQQAAELGQSLAVELRFLVLHGVLHLLGFDHETDQGEMVAEQSRIRQKLGSFFEDRS
ncbi:MAG: rRNA maturation RNase YbeY [Acidobacteria bacterium]|nr:rRNA maturation RNase YbeY [Acidobacteriota bacterium]